MHALAENSLKFQRIKQNSFNSPTDSANDAKFAPFIYPLYIMFQMLTIGRELSKIPANQAEFAQFAHRLRE